MSLRIITIIAIVSTILLTAFSVNSEFNDSKNNNQEKSIPEEMILIPAGKFDMGITQADLEELVEIGKKVPHMTISHAEYWFGDERPLHTVEIRAFYMDKYEVTNREFADFVNDTDYIPEGDWRKYAGKNREGHPVVNVTWNDAKAYADWAGKRLPTEEEWEYAALGGRDVKWFPWGNEPDPQATNYRYQGESFLDGIFRMIFGRDIKTTVVGSYKPNGYGLYDMCGNVREWCESDYEAYPGLKEEHWQHTKHRPFSKDKPDYVRKVARGGHWDSSNPVYIRIKNRTGIDMGTQWYTTGFRCVRPVN